MIHFSTDEMNMDRAYSELLQTLDVIGPDDVHGADNPRGWWHGLMYEWNANGWYHVDEYNDIGERNEHYFHDHMPNLVLTGYEFPRRWNMLVRDYLPDDWEKMLTKLRKDKDAFYYSETGVWMKSHEARDEDTSERDGWHPRGNCMVLLSYSVRRFKERVKVRTSLGKGSDGKARYKFVERERSVRRMVATLMSRTCYLLPLGPLDASFAMIMTRELCKALGIQEFRVRWFLSQAQIQTWPAAVWYANGPIGAGTMRAPGLEDGTLRVETDARSLYRWRQRELLGGQYSDLEVRHGAMVTDITEDDHDQESHIRVMGPEYKDIHERCVKGSCKRHMSCMYTPCLSVPYVAESSPPYKYFHGIWPLSDPRNKYSTPTIGATWSAHMAELAKSHEAIDEHMRQSVERVGSSTLPIAFSTELGTSYWLSNFLVDTIKYRFHNPYFVNKKYRMCHRWSFNYNRVRDLIEEGGPSSIYRAKDFFIPSSSSYYRQIQRDEVEDE